MRIACLLMTVLAMTSIIFLIVVGFSARKLSFSMDMDDIRIVSPHRGSKWAETTVISELSGTYDDDQKQGIRIYTLPEYPRFVPGKSFKESQSLTRWRQKTDFIKIYAGEGSHINVNWTFTRTTPSIYFGNLVIFKGRSFNRAFEYSPDGYLVKHEIQEAKGAFTYYVKSFDYDVYYIGIQSGIHRGLVDYNFDLQTYDLSRNTSECALTRSNPRCYIDSRKYAAVTRVFENLSAANLVQVSDDTTVSSVACIVAFFLFGTLALTAHLIDQCLKHKYVPLSTEDTVETGLEPERVTTEAMQREDTAVDQLPKYEVAPEPPAYESIFREERTVASRASQF